jgi:glycosyltransferase involved in cell wall biosynthesis
MSVSNTAAPDSVSFIVPAFNEEKNVEGVVAELHKVAKLAQIGAIEIVLVNDASTDGTGAVMAGLAAAHPDHIRYVENPVNLSLGGAYKAGVRNATKTYVMLVPGDNEHPAEGLLPILEQRGKADIVIPYVENPEVRPLARRLVSRLFTAIINIYFGLKVPYYNSLVIHKRSLLQEITIATDGFAYQAEAVVKLLKRGCDFVTVGTVITARREGASKAFRLHNVRKVLGALLHLMRTA